MLRHLLLLLHFVVFGSVDRAGPREFSWNAVMGALRVAMLAALGAFADEATRQQAQLDPKSALIIAAIVGIPELLRRYFKDYRP